MDVIDVGAGRALRHLVRGPSPTIKPAYAARDSHCIHEVIGGIPAPRPKRSITRLIKAFDVITGETVLCLVSGPSLFSTPWDCWLTYRGWVETAYASIVCAEPQRAVTSLNRAAKCVVTQAVLCCVGGPAGAIIMLYSGIRREPYASISILVDVSQAAQLSDVELGPPPSLRHRIGRGNLERVHGVGGDRQQQAEDGGIGAHRDPRCDGEERRASVADGGEYEN